jgi:hypothetical protein
VATTAVRSAAIEELPMVVHTIVAAFAADPVVRWVWPEAHQYLESMPAFTVAFAGGGFSDGGAHTTDGYRGALRIVDQTVAKSLQRDLGADGQDGRLSSGWTALVSADDWGGPGASVKGPWRRAPSPRARTV